MKLPLSVDEQQAISDRANPLEIPALVDSVARLQDILEGIRTEAASLRRDGCTDVEEYRDFVGYCLRVIGQIMPDGGEP